MKRPVSPMPDRFRNDKEQHYWHAAQDIAYRARVVITERDGASWLMADGEERLLSEACLNLWFQTWRILKAEFPQHSRSWVGGRPITKPGE